MHGYIVIKTRFDPVTGESTWSHKAHDGFWLDEWDAQRLARKVRNGLHHYIDKTDLKNWRVSIEVKQLS